MALTGSTIASTYLKLLRINTDTMGADATASYIQDSADTDSALSISTTRVGIGNSNPGVLFEVGVMETSGTAGNFHLKSDANHLAMHIEENSGAEGWGIGVNADGDLGFHNSFDATASIVMADSGNVGIGIAAPNSPLDIKSTGADTNVFEIEKSGSAGAMARFYEGASGEGVFSLYDATPTEDVRISTYGDSWFNGGDVGIGIAAPAGLLHLKSASAINTYIDSDSDKEIWFRQANGTNQHELKFTSSKMYLTTRTSIPIEFGINDAPKMTIETSGDVTVEAGNLVIGTADKGIDFDGNSRTAVLDDYEEGSFGTTSANGILKDLGSGSVTCGTTVHGRYTKVGRVVTISVRAIHTASDSPDGNLAVVLPFACVGFPVGALRFTNITFSGYMIVQADDSESHAKISETATGSGITYIAASDISVTDELRCGMTYLST